MAAPVPSSGPMAGMLLGLMFGIIIPRPLPLLPSSHRAQQLTACCAWPSLAGAWTATTSVLSPSCAMGAGGFEPSPLD